MISGHANIQSAVAATKLGAADFIQKPFSVTGLLASIARVLDGGACRTCNRERDRTGRDQWRIDDRGGRARRATATDHRAFGGFRRPGTA